MELSLVSFAVREVGLLFLEGLNKKRLNCANKVPDKEHLCGSFAIEML